MSETFPSIDWEKFHQWPPNEVWCVCGAVYHSHTKLVEFQGRLVQVAEHPCPGCGASYDHAKKVSSPPEKWTL